MFFVSQFFFRSNSLSLNSGHNTNGVRTRQQIQLWHEHTNLRVMSHFRAIESENVLFTWVLRMQIIRRKVCTILIWINRAISKIETKTENREQKQTRERREKEILHEALSSTLIYTARKCTQHGNWSVNTCFASGLGRKPLIYSGTRLIAFRIAFKFQLILHIPNRRLILNRSIANATAAAAVAAMVTTTCSRIVLIKFYEYSCQMCI